MSFPVTALLSITCLSVAQLLFAQSSAILLTTFGAERKFGPDTLVVNLDQLPDRNHFFRQMELNGSSLTYLFVEDPLSTIDDVPFHRFDHLTTLVLDGSGQGRLGHLPTFFYKLPDLETLTLRNLRVHPELITKVNATYPFATWPAVDIVPGRNFYAKKGQVNSLFIREDPGGLTRRGDSLYVSVHHVHRGSTWDSINEHRNSIEVVYMEDPRTTVPLLTSRYLPSMRWLEISGEPGEDTILSLPFWLPQTDYAEKILITGVTISQSLLRWATKFPDIVEFGSVRTMDREVVNVLILQSTDGTCTRSFGTDTLCIHRPKQLRELAHQYGPTVESIFVETPHFNRVPWHRFPQLKIVQVYSPKMDTLREIPASFLTEVPILQFSTFKVDLSYELEQQLTQAYPLLGISRYTLNIW